MNKITLIISSAYSAIISSVFVVVITIWADLAAPLKDWLKSVTGHHWTTKSVFTALIFTLVMIILYALRKKHTDNVKKSLTLLLIFVITGSILITAFYTGHHFKIW